VQICCQVRQWEKIEIVGHLITLWLKLGGLLFGPPCILSYIEHTLPLHRDFICHAEKADKYATTASLTPQQLTLWSTTFLETWIYTYSGQSAHLSVQGHVLVVRDLFSQSGHPTMSVYVIPLSSCDIAFNRRKMVQKHEQWNRDVSSQQKKTTFLDNSSISLHGILARICETANQKCRQQCRILHTHTNHCICTCMKRNIS